MQNVVTQGLELYQDHGIKDKDKASDFLNQTYMITLSKERVLFQNPIGV